MPNWGAIETCDSSGILVHVLAGPMRVTRALIAYHRSAWQDVFDEILPLREPTNLDRRVELLTRWLTAAAFEHLAEADSSVFYFERVVQPEPVNGEERPSMGIPYSFAHFRLGKLYTQLEQYDRAEEHYLTFLETFTQPDPEYEWMVTEAREQLEELARGR